MLGREGDEEDASYLAEGNKEMENAGSGILHISKDVLGNLA